jgi:hypothetical protein
MTRYSSAGSGGRQLLDLGRRISAETDPDVLRVLRRREVRILVSMGQREEAASRAGKLAGDFPLWPEAHALLGDILCRVRDWKGAEAGFRTAVGLHSEAGDAAKAARLAQGPLYRLTEAVGDYRECMRLAAWPGFTSPVLASRAGRLAGSPSDPPDESGDGYPSEALLELELAWRGGDGSRLPLLVRDWPGFEPEWRWRVLVEGVRIWRDRKRDCRIWRKPLGDTERPVLDPRFDTEAAALDGMFRCGRGGSR